MMDNKGIEMHKAPPESQPLPDLSASEKTAMPPSLATLRAYLYEYLLTEPDFDGFCIDYFASVHKRFSSGMDRTSKTNLLLTCATPEEIYEALCDYCPALLTGRLPMARSTPLPAKRSPLRVPGLWGLLVGISIGAALGLSTIVLKRKLAASAVAAPTSSGPVQELRKPLPVVDTGLIPPVKPMSKSAPPRRAAAIPAVLEILTDAGDDVRLIGNGVNKQAIADYKVIPSDEGRTLRDVPRALLQLPLVPGHYRVQCQRRGATSETIHIDVDDKQTHYELKTTCRYR